MPPASVLSYLESVCAALQRLAGDRMRAVYLHGSAALGGWMPGRSDVDVLFVVADDTGPHVVGALARALLDTADMCPGRGLESSVVTVHQIALPRPPWPFLAHVATGPGEPQGGLIKLGSELPGDTDLLMHYAVCRAAGWRVRGPAPGELIGPISRQAILGYLADELHWGLEHALEAYAVLNACRAAVYLTDGTIVSKIDGGETVLRRGTGPAEVIRRALRQQRGVVAEQPTAPDAVPFVLATAAGLAAAHADS